MTDREKLIEHLRWWAKGCDRTNSGCQVNLLLEKAADELANGVTIPVRCKDCKHYDGQECYHPRAEMGDALGIDPTDFCSYGERRGNDLKESNPIA